MNFDDLRNKMIELTIEGKQYALIPLCLFHDIDDMLRHDIVEKQFGLMDTFSSMNIYEITDPKKVMLMKIKYGV